MLPLRQVSLIFGTMLASSISNSIQATDYLCGNDHANAAPIPAGLSSETPLVKFTQVAVAHDLKRYQVVEHQNGVLFRSMGEQPSLVGLTRRSVSTQYGSTLILSAQDEIKLPPGTLAYWNDISSDQTLPQMTGKYPVKIQNGNIDSALLAFSPRRDITSHTINTPDTKAQLQDSIKPPVAGPAKAILNYYQKPELSTCTQSITSEYQAANSSLKGAGMGFPQQIARQYLTDKKSFYDQHKEKDFQKLTETYIGTLKALVQNCYVPAENSSFAIQHSLLTRMGQINWGQNTACTGLSVGSATYVLTARHCFEKLPNQSDLWFKPAMSNDRYQICAISQSNALTEDKFSDISQDQVLVRIAPGLKEPGELKVMLKSALRSMDDQKAGDSSAPTLLTQISYMPLANLLFPTTFPSGFVQGKAELCAAKEKDPGCFSHLCSTESGGSGSALFVTSEPVLTLAGTHIGESEKGSDSKTSNTCEESYGLNVATYINKNFLEFFPKTVSFIGNQ